MHKFLILITLSSIVLSNDLLEELIRKFGKKSAQNLEKEIGIIVTDLTKLKEKLEKHKEIFFRKCVFSETVFLNCQNIVFVYIFQI